MKLTYQPAYVIINVIKADSEIGIPYTVFVPENCDRIAIDKDGKIHAYSGHTWKDDKGWDNCTHWEEVADLECEVITWENTLMELPKFTCVTRCGGLLNVHI